jgi:hypothetical protein
LLRERGKSAEASALDAPVLLIAPPSLVGEGIALALDAPVLLIAPPSLVGEGIALANMVFSPDDGDLAMSE